MSPILRKHFRRELMAGSAYPSSDPVASWKALERAHILSQAHPLQHIQVHWAMLLFALRSRNISEAVGQIIRLLLAGPASLLGRAPLGNTGGADVGLWQTLPVPTELKELLDADETYWKELNAQKEEEPPEVR